jgi:hypothetical protein
VRPPVTTLPVRRPGTLQERRVAYHGRAAAVRRHVVARPLPVYGPNWWARYPSLRHARWHFWNRPWRYWWRRATWAAVTGWFVWSWPQPIYYDYGGNVYYENNTVYVDGKEVSSAEQYAQQMAAVANSVPEDVDAEEVEWMPLGVFALVTEEQEEPTMYVQLAVSKEGIIAGTYTNTDTDSAQPLEGMVDKKTQRAAWTVGENKNTVFETGIYNLTQEETPVLVHFGSQQTQQWLLVRLEEPASDEEGS